MSITVIDIIFAALILILIIRCALKGFVEEFMSMASVVLGILAAVFFYKNGGQFIRSKFGMEIQVIPELIAFIALFLIVFIVVKFVEYLLRDIVNRINLTGIDRILGVVFGLLEGVVLVSLVLLIISIQPLFDPLPLLEHSFFARLLLPLIGVVQRSVFTVLAAV
ncbi:CvpA family protein [Breznakiella homolactica]|uniref:CvpA family protein n=1 Tax=Breznakiella homolactica TaxID=2798577 RepID=A0A7T7XL03_9SPIR|nr:CvpA family protein [Breznakiella homolactica]QQO08231.1 CvpA family protein [Breznakiella homolactica]